MYRIQNACTYDTHTQRNPVQTPVLFFIKKKNQPAQHFSSIFTTEFKHFHIQDKPLQI